MLEELLVYVKFLLVMMDLQKLLVMILFCCLQFYLKVLDVEQICYQLEYIFGEEQIVFEFCVLQLLLWVVDGSLCDVLSLIDQVIVSGEGQLMVVLVSIMFGIFDDDQVLLLIEVLVVVDGEWVMVSVNDVVVCGVEWEVLLVEMQSLLYCIVMVQLLFLVLGVDMVVVEVWMCELV